MFELSGVWQFAIDPKDAGLDQQWWRQGLPMQIRLPGSLQEQGYGEDPGLDTAWVGTIIDRSLFEDPRYAPYREPGSFKVPFWLQPEKYYAGPAWVQRTIHIPPEWQGRRLTLTLERPHWETAAWLDDLPLGRCDSLATAHVYDLGTQVAPGEHRLTIRIDNRMVVDVGPNAHSMSDHTQSNWNGIVGCIELAAASPVWLRTANNRLGFVNKAYANAVEARDANDVAAQQIELLDSDERVALTQGLATTSTFAARVPIVISGDRRIFDLRAVSNGKGSAAIALDASEAADARAAPPRMPEAHRPTLDPLAPAVAIFDAHTPPAFSHDPYRHF